MPKPIQRSRPDLYQEVTAKVIDALEKGQFPWWSDSMWNAAGVAAVPYNAISGHAYRGWNNLYLMNVAARLSEEGSFDPRFCTFKQASEKGWHIKKGSTGFPVYLFKPCLIQVRPKEQEEGKPAKGRILDKLDALKKGNLPTAGDDSVATGQEEDEVIPTKQVWVLRSFTVFHASQVVGIPDLVPVKPTWSPNETVEKILQGMMGTGMAYAERGDSAFYSPSRDLLVMPPKAAFESVLKFSHVLTHELGHATGHESRLKRTFGNAGTEGYAKEELVAEMASAMMCSQLGLTYDVTRHADYVDSWLKQLKSDKRLLLRAAGMAGRACDYMIDQVPGLKEELQQGRMVGAGVSPADQVPEVVDLADGLDDWGGDEDPAVWVSTVMEDFSVLASANRPVFEVRAGM